MASSLRKYKYTGKTSANEASSDKANANNTVSITSGPSIPANPSEDTASTMSDHNEQYHLQDLKSELLSCIKVDMTELFQREVTKVITHEIEGVKSELQSVKLEIANNTAALRSELDTVKSTVLDVERVLSVHSDDITTLQATVRKLEKTVESLQEKSVDMEGRMRRSNIRILNVAEGSPSTPVAVSRLLREVLKLDKDILVDRSHRTLQGKRADGKPRAIIAKLHYYQDAVDVLRRARDATGPLHHNGSTIFIFPDYPASVARARSAFNDVKKLLRGREGVRYGLLYPARLRITHNGGEKIFMDPAEATTYVEENL